MNYAWCLLSGHTALSVLPLHMQRRRRRLSYGDHREQWQLRVIHREEGEEQRNTEDNTKHGDVQ